MTSDMLMVVRQSPGAFRVMAMYCLIWLLEPRVLKGFSQLTSRERDT